MCHPRPILFADLARLAGSLGCDPAALARDHEPYLFRLGLATTTPQGRVAVNGNMSGRRPGALLGRLPQGVGLVGQLPGEASLT